MKTLEQIKEEYAIVYCQYPSWEDFINDIPSHEVESHMNEVAKIYSTEYAKEALRLASENARVMTKNIDTENELEVLSWTDSRNVKFTMSKQSILSEDNLPKHIL